MSHSRNHSLDRRGVHSDLFDDGDSFDDGLRRSHDDDHLGDWSFFDDGFWFGHFRFWFWRWDSFFDFRLEWSRFLNDHHRFFFRFFFLLVRIMQIGCNS